MSATASAPAEARQGDAAGGSSAGAQVFKDLTADMDGDAKPMEVESLCMNCHENGTTTLLFTRIPHFREVVVMAFECPHCGFRNNEIQPAASIADKGCRYTLTVKQGDVRAANRQLVKSESATMTIPELDFEIPAGTQKGVLSTVEGMLKKAVENLQELQEERRKVRHEGRLRGWRGRRRSARPRGASPSLYDTSPPRLGLLHV